MNNASFGKRLVSYIIDMIIISFIATLIMTFIPSKEIDTTKSEKIMEQYIEGKITMKEYTEQISVINYDIEQNNVPSYIVSFTLIFIYFVILQYKLKGQTIGKKIMNIKIVNNENKEVKINDFIFRSLIINELGFSILNLISILLLKEDAFTYTIGILNLLNLTLIFTCAIMVITRNDKRGLHDFIGHTNVIELKK